MVTGQESSIDEKLGVAGLGFTASKVVFWAWTLGKQLIASC